MSQVTTPSRTPAANAAAPNKRRDLYQEVTDKIIAAIEAGTAPWQRPWTEVRAAGMPMNGATERPYSGVNAVLLMMTAQAQGFTDNRWFTMKQANDMGLRVRKGSTSTPVYFFKMLDVPGKDAMSPPTSDAPTSGNTADGKRIPFLTDYRVFHASQIEGLEPALAPTRTWAPIETVTEIVGRLNPDIRHGGNRAFYAPAGDYIQMPEQGAFADAAAYSGTLLHEISHWSGHESRLNRSFAKWGYAMEELRAELCSTFLCSFLGVPGPVDPHASYIESWVKVLRSDNREIFRAAKDARQMADFLTGQLVLDVKPEPGESAQPTATMHPTPATPVQTMPTVSPAVSAVLSKARMGSTTQGRSRAPVRRNGLVHIGAVLGDTAITSPVP